MAGFNANNLAGTSLSSDIESGDSSIDVVDDSVFPSTPFRATIEDQTNLEIVEVTSVSSNTLTVERGKEDTSAQSFSSGSDIEQRFTAGMYEELSTISNVNNEIDNIEADSLDGNNGTSGQVLQTDGSNAFWQSISTGASVSDDGTEIESSPNDLNFGDGLNVSTDGDGSVSVAEANFDVNSLTVAGNTVSLGGSTSVDYTDLNDTGNSFPIENSDLDNSSVDIAGNTVALGSSTSISSEDLSDSDNIDAKTVQGNAPSDLGANPDGRTIVEDSNGELRAKLQSTTIIGDFESSLGGWNLQGGNSERQNNGAQGTNKNVRLNSNVENSSLTRNVDFNKASKLVFFKKITADNGPNPGLSVKIDSQQVYSDTGVDSGFLRVEIDVSNINGFNNLEFVTIPGSGSFDTFGVLIDRIKLLTEGAESGITFDGAGN